LSAASITKAASADSVGARAAASHTGVLADRPILMAGQVSPKQRDRRAELQPRDVSCGLGRI